MTSDVHFLEEAGQLKGGRDKVRSKRNIPLAKTEDKDETGVKTERMSETNLNRRRRDFPTGCCPSGVTIVKLTNNAPFNKINDAFGIDVISGPTAQRGITTDCSKMALLKVNFERIQTSNNCVNSPMCGRRMLRIDLKLSPGTRSKFLFNVGDSRTNNGYSGDRSTQENDSEGEGLFPHVQVYGSDKCQSRRFGRFTNAISSAVSSVTIYVGPQYFRVLNDQGFDEYVCDSCIFALSGQSDNQGSVNEDVYVALNRVVDGTYRNGIGVCSATLSWVCPWYY